MADDIRIEIADRIVRNNPEQPHSHVAPGVTHELHAIDGRGTSK